MQKNIFSILVLLVLSSFTSISGQVNLQSGSAEYSIPLHNYSDQGNRLSAGVSLLYTGGNGLKVTDVAGSVGTGWILNVGGVITRIQNGEPDDQKQDGIFNDTYPGSNPSGWLNYVNNYYPNGYMYSEYNPATLVDDGSGYTPMLPGNYAGGYRVMPAYLADREMDMFTFTFNGRQGTFVIGKNGTIKVLQDSRLKIDKVITDMSSSNIITRIKEFHILDEVGIKYVFKDIELSEVMKYETAPGIGGFHGEIAGNTSHSLMVGTGINKFVVQKWYLSEIVNPLTNKKIIFTYETYNVDMPGAKNAYRNAVNPKVNTSLIIEHIKGVSKRLINIKLSDKDDLSFVYSTGFRQDLSFDKTLDEVQVKYDNTTRFSWKFSYGYFVDDLLKLASISLTQAEKYKARLALISVQRFGMAGPLEPARMMDYYLGTYNYTYNGTNYTDNLGVSPLFSLYNDHRGYPNRTSGTVNASLNEYRSDIQYDNIDWTTVENYSGSANLYKESYSQRCLAGVLKSVKNQLGGKLIYEYEPNMATIGASTQNYIGGVRVSKTILDDGDASPDIITEYKYVRIDGFSSGWGFETPVYSTSKPQRVYNCGNGFKPVESIKQWASTLPSAMANSVINSATSSVTVGQSIAQEMIGNFVAMIVIYFLNEILSPDYTDFTSNESSTFSKTTGNELPYQHSRVEVIKKNGVSDIGKMVYEFTSDQDYPVDVPTLATANSKRPRFASWSYGAPKRITVLDKNGLIVKKTEYAYVRSRASMSDNNFVSQKWNADKFTFGCSASPGTGLPTTNTGHDVYYPMYGNMQLTQTKEYTYNSAGESFFTTTDYEYSTLNYQVKKMSSTNSKGELIETFTYYPDDYTYAGLQSMKAPGVNIVNVPVSSQTIITKTGNLKYVLSGTVAEYSSIGNGDYRPFKMYSFRSANPILASSAAFNPAVIIPSTTYKEISNTSYNAAGLASQVVSEQGIVSYVYDYNNAIPIATVENAAVLDIAFTSFEAEGKGGWTFDAAQIVEDFSPAGKKSYRSTFGFDATISRTIVNTKKYILSFWKKGENPILSGATFTLKRSYVNTATGFTYYEYEVTNGTNVSIVNSYDDGGILSYYSYTLDELRLYPVGSVMTTLTYEPLVGKTSESDVNGRINYYEYDERARLKLLRDENRNVLKTYEYNFIQ